MFCTTISNNDNKTGLPPVSRPVEQILGFYPKGLSAKMCSKNYILKKEICVLGEKTPGK